MLYLVEPESHPVDALAESVELRFEGAGNRGSQSFVVELASGIRTKSAGLPGVRQ